VNRKPKRADDPDRLIPLAEAAWMLGLSPDALRKGYAHDHGLLLLDQGREGNQRPRWFMVRRQVIEFRFELIEKAKMRHRKVFGSFAVRPPYETWQSQVITDGPRVTDSPDERLMTLKEAGHILGVSAYSLRTRTAPRGVDTLTFIDITLPNRERRSYRLVFSEVIALRDELIERGARDGEGSANLRFEILQSGSE
jgi:hypothetical protein